MPSNAHLRKCDETRLPFQYLTLQDVARICLVSPRTVTDWIKSGRLAAKRPIRSPRSAPYLVDSRKLEEFLSDHWPEHQELRPDHPKASYRMVWKIDENRRNLGRSTQRAQHAKRAAKLYSETSDPGAMVRENGAQSSEQDTRSSVPSADSNARADTGQASPVPSTEPPDTDPK